MKPSKETKQLLAQESATLYDKEKGKNYVLSDFLLSFKNNPECQDDFYEVVVNYLYHNRNIKYFLFVDKKLDVNSALENAKEQLQILIDKGEMREYAKYYYKLFY